MAPVHPASGTRSFRPNDYASKAATTRSRPRTTSGCPCISTNHDFSPEKSILREWKAGEALDVPGRDDIASMLLLGTMPHVAGLILAGTAAMKSPSQRCGAD